MKPKKPTQPLTEDDLQTHLAEQLQFLQASAEAFDKGFEAEAKRLAVTLRVLLHDTASSESLLGQLGKKSEPFLDTALPESGGNLIDHGGLVGASMGDEGVKHIALFDDVPFARPISFEKWWNVPAFRTRDGETFSRRDLVTTAANQDGGAHVDPELDASYARLKANGLGWSAAKGAETGEVMTGAERVALRQVAHEVLKTMVPGYAPAPRKPTGVLISGFSLQAVPEPPQKSSSSAKRPGRNDPCLCQSGKKFKKCCGR